MKVKDVQHGKTTRKSFARINEILEMPNLIEVQKKSYQWFLDEGLVTASLKIHTLTVNYQNITKYSQKQVFINWYWQNLQTANRLT